MSEKAKSNKTKINSLQDQDSNEKVQIEKLRKAYADLNNTIYRTSQNLEIEQAKEIALEQEFNK